MFDKSMNQAPLGLSDSEEPIEIELVPDGGELVATPEGDTGEGYDHFANLADTLSDQDLTKLSSELDAHILNDIASRADWEKTYREGLKLLGLKNEERMEPWDGACGITHPMITEAVVRFQAELTTETFPASGPVRTKILGKETLEKKQAAARVEEDLNHQLTDVMQEYRPEHERLLWALPMTGSAFKKVYYDPTLGRQTSVFVPAEDIIMPYGTTDLMTCNRMTHAMRKTKIDVRRLQRAGFYRDIPLSDPAPSTTDIQDSKDKATGVNALNDDRLELYEVHVDMALDEYKGAKEAEEAAEPVETDDGGVEVELEADTQGDAVAETEDDVVKPYVVTFIKGTGQVLAIRRNWEEDDALFLKRQHMVHYQYVPGFGAYGYGLIHLIGGYAKAATATLRQLIDAGTLSNLPGGLKTRGLRIKGDDTPIAPGEFRDVDVGGGTIRDNIMPLPYKEPSLVLAALLDKIIEQGQRFSSTADLDIGNASAQTPVGTTLALLERSLKIMSAVQARCHASLKQELKLIAGIIRDYADESYSYDPDTGPRRARKADFSMVDVIPVSDPNAATMSQRVIQFQAVMQMAQTAPQVYDLAMVHRTMLEVLGIKHAEKLVPLPDDAKPRDPVTENMALLTGKPTKAFLMQDHEAHMSVHMGLMQDPKIQAAIGQNPQAQTIQAALMAHVAEHAAFAYRLHVSQQLGMPLPDPEEDLDPMMERQLAPMLAQAAQQALMQNQKMAAQQQAAQMQQDPAFQLESQKVQNDTVVAKAKADKTKADIALMADRLELDRDKFEASQADGVADLSLRKDQQDQQASAEGIRLSKETAPARSNA